jgi:hypothetical protein
VPDLRAWLGEVEKLGQLMTVDSGFTLGKPPAAAGTR